MTPFRLTSFSLIPLLGLFFSNSYPAIAQTAIGGGGNSNPSTNTGNQPPTDNDKKSNDDGRDDSEIPPSPPPTKPEGKKSCEDDDKDPDTKRPETTPPKAPGSVNLSFSLEACPLEYSVAVGGLQLYLDAPTANMWDPILLKYNSIAAAKVGQRQRLPAPLNRTAGGIATPAPSPDDLPNNVKVRYIVTQISGQPLAFDLYAGNPILKPSGSGASSNARAELRDDAGVILSTNTFATRFRQYRSAGGYMEFALPAGNILKWVGPTGRALDFTSGTSAMGLEVISPSGPIRQVKSPAGLLDVVPDSDGRGYRVVTYLPLEVGVKSGNLFTLTPTAQPSKTVHIVHPLGTQKLIATFTDHGPDSTQDRTRTLTYTYVPTFDGGHEWDMKTEADGMAMSSTRRVIPDPDAAGMRRVVREVTDGSGKLLLKKESVQQFFTQWNGWTTLQDIQTPAGDVSLRTVQTYRYGIDSSNTDFRKLNWQMTENGSVYEFKYDAEGRMIERRHPWLDGADGKYIIEKYAYVPFGPGEVVLPGDGRPRTTTTEVGTVGGSNPIISKSYFAAYNDAANGGRHTVINEDAATPTSGYGNAANRRKKQVFYAASTTVEAGRLMEVTDENGLLTQFTYVARVGGGFTETMTGPLSATGTAKAAVTRRMIRQKDGFDRMLTTRDAFYDGAGYVDFQEDLNVYSPQGQVTSVLRTDLKSNRQRLISSYQWRGDQMVAMTPEDGSTRGTQMDGFDRQVATTQAGVPASGSPITSGLTYPAQPAVIRTTTGTMIASMERADWGDRTTTTTAGSLTLTESSKADARSRVTEETDADGYTTQITHLRNGLEQTITRPDGSTVNTQYFLDGKIKQRSGTGIIPEYYNYTANAAGGMTTTVRLGSAVGVRYQATTVDLLGRTISQAIPGNGGAITVSSSYIGGSSRPARVISSAPGVAVKFFEYDAFAIATRQGETVRGSANGLDLSSASDRIQESEISMLNDATGLWQVRRQFAYPNEGATAATRYLLTESRSKIAGFMADETQRTYSVDGLGNWQQQVTEERVADRLRIERVTSNGSPGEAVTVYHGGLMVEQRRPADTVSTRMSYDALGRLISSKQPHHTRGSSTVYTTGKNQVISRSDATGAVTSYGYFPQGVLGAGRVASVTYADATVRRSAYDIRGNMTNEWGSATAPTSYRFDGYNQLETLSTYRTAITADSVVFPATIGTPDVTTWVRQEATGLLTQKKYADNQGPVYLYDIAGRITRRTFARGSVTDYTYTAWGQPDVTNYADATPDADIDYDRMGRKTRESNGTATSTYQYSATTLRPTLETITYDINRDGTPELTRQLNRSHDNLRRPTGFTLKDGTTTETTALYGYDPYSRLAQISNPQISNQIFNYSYLQNSSLLASVTGPVHIVTNTWELDRDVLDAKENKVGAVTVSKLDYSVNVIGQRTALSQTGTAFASVRGIAWTYDSYGQVTSADSTLATQDRAYQYDAIGNRKKSADSLTLPVIDNYITNSLNQYTSRSVGVSPTLNPIYDLDGNATSYPLPVLPTTNSTLTWDGENRLTSTTVNGTTTTQQFDSTGRRISKTTGTATRLYLYEGWNVIAEYERGTGVSPVLTLKKNYLWGTDLSGTLQGAGGVGGLLSEFNISNPQSPISYPTYDGNGNISEYLTSTGSVAAHFEYDPFGNTTINTDTTNQFTYKFSTKPQDFETGLYYYGYRFYDPVMGRWLGRDPIDEHGGINLYGFVGNDGSNRWDFLGMACCPLPDGLSGPPATYNEKTSCCIKGRVIERKLISIGVTRNQNFKDQNDLTPTHAWLEFPGGSAGFWPGEGGPFNGLGRIFSPDPYVTNPTKQKYVWTEDIFVNPCEIDIDKFIECLKNSGTTSGGNYVWGLHDCRHWSLDRLSACRKEAMRK
jgi:RHS repeat-associated protein